jgi:hypothetical protein
MRLALLILAAAVVMPAQQANTPNPPSPRQSQNVQALYQVKHADPQALYRVVYTSSQSQPTPILRVDEQLRVITVYGSPSEVNSIISNLQKLDVPSASLTDRNIELTMYIVLASNETMPGDPVPPALDPAVRQLKTTFGLKEFRLLDAAVMRGRTGERNQLSGNAATVGAKGKPSTYQASLHRFGARRTSDGTVIRVDEFNFDIRVPDCLDPECKQANYVNVVYRTNLDMREGQFVVVGKSKADGSDRSIIVIVTARVAD